MRQKLASLLRILPAILLPPVLLLSGDPLQILPTLAALALHECGHLAAFSLLGEPEPSLCFSLGGFRFVAKRPLSLKAEALICAAGPFANLAAGLLLLLLSLQGGGAQEYLVFSAALQFSSGAWNLLPIADLDGARIICCLLARLAPAAAECAARAISLAALFLGLTVSLGVLYFSGAAFYTSLAFFLLLLATP